MTRTRKDQAVRQSKEAGNESVIGAPTSEKRFAFSLLEKLLEYVDKAAYNMKNTKPSSRFSRRHSFSMSSEDVKFFGKVPRILIDVATVSASVTYLHKDMHFSISAAELCTSWFNHMQCT